MAVGFVGSCSTFVGRKSGWGRKPLVSSRTGMLPARSVVARRGSWTAGLVNKINSERFEKELVESELPLLVDFYASWCGPCQFMVPELEAIAAQYEGKVKVLKVDTDEESDLSTMLQVRGLPTLFFIKDKELRFRFEGALMRDQMSDVIDQAFFGKAPRHQEQSSTVSNDSSSS